MSGTEDGEKDSRRYVSRFQPELKYGSDCTSVLRTTYPDAGSIDFSSHGTGVANLILERVGDNRYIK